MSDEPTKPRGLAPNSSGRVPGPLGGRPLGGRLPGALARNPAPPRPVVLKFDPAKPIAYLDASFSAKEQAKMLANLQVLTDDHLRLNGLEVYSDGSGKAASNLKTGQALLRGLQSPVHKVVITPNASITGGISSSTHWDTHFVDINVDLQFANGDVASFKFFTLTGATVPVAGAGIDADSVVKPPGYIVLAHELIHAYRMLRFLKPSGSEDHPFGDPAGNKFTEKAKAEELTVVGINGTEPITENNIRVEQGIGIRVSYASTDFPLNSQGVTPVSAQPSWWPNYP